MSAYGPFQNTVLQHLGPEALDRLQLKRKDLPVQADLAVPGQMADEIVFVERGVGSMTTMFRDGAGVEVCMFGYESIVGVSAMMGARRSLNRVFMQIAGYGYSSPVLAARREFDCGGELQRLALSYVQAQLTQSMQNAACNAVHSAEERLTRWLLTARDRAATDTFKLTHEFLAYMLGSTRATASIAMGVLREKGLIEYTRGMAHLLDPEGMERETCECYEVVRGYLHNSTQFDDDFVR